MQKKKSNTFSHNFKFDALQTIYTAHKHTNNLRSLIFKKTQEIKLSRELGIDTDRYNLAWITDYIITSIEVLIDLFLCQNLSNKKIGYISMVHFDLWNGYRYVEPILVCYAKKKKKIDRYVISKSEKIRPSIMLDKI